MKALATPLLMMMMMVMIRGRTEYCIKVLAQRDEAEWHLIATSSLNY